jgi:hypothetical protein
MAYTQKINFYKVRNFNQKLNVTIEFIRQNALSLGKPIIYILGPLAILNGLLFSQYINFSFENLSGQQTADVQNPFAMFLTPSYFGFLVLSFFSTSVNFSVIFNFMKLYKSKYPEEITVVDVLNAALEDLLPLILLNIITSIFMVVGFVALLIPGIYLMVVFSLAIPTICFEGKGIFESIGRSFKLIKEKWWSTFGLLIVSTIIMYIVSLLFSIPSLILTSIKDLADISIDGSSMWFQGSMTIAVIVMLLGSYLSYSIPMIALSFQYFNLVERGESVGLMSEIEELDSGE